MKRFLIILSVVLALIAGGTLYYFVGKRYEVVIRQDQIDTALSERFPASKKYLDKVTEIASEAAKEFDETKVVYKLETKGAKTTGKAPSQGLRVS